MRSSSSSSARTAYAGPLSKQSKRASWGANGPPPGAEGDQGDGGNGGGGSGPYTSSSAASSAGLRDFFPDRELLASSADCLRIWEISRNEQWSGSAVERQREEQRRNSGFVNSPAGGAGRRRPMSAAYDAEGRLRFELVEKSVLAHVSLGREFSCPLPIAHLLTTTFSRRAPHHPPRRSRRLAGTCPRPR